jgi:hypothetical protein
LATPSNGAAADIAALHLAATASTVEVGKIVTVVLTPSHLPPGTRLTLQAPQGGAVWRGISNCAAPDRSKTDVPADAATVLCVTSHETQTVRAVVSATLPDGTTLFAVSEPIKFSGDPWWKSTILTSALIALLGTAFGLASTLTAQNYERRKKSAEEKRALAVEQAQFLVRNLLPELASHVLIFKDNEALAALAAADVKQVKMLPKTNLVTTAGGARAQQLAAYFASVDLKRDVIAQVQRYAEHSAQYNTAAVKVQRGTMPLAELIASSQELRRELEALGFT